MGAIITGNHYNNWSELSKQEIQMSDNTAKKILNGRESLSQTEFKNTSIYNEFKDNENFTKLVESFGTEIDAEELSFLVTVLDASKYNAHAYGEDCYITEDGEITNNKDSAQGFYLDGVYSKADNLLEVSHENFEQFKQARANANKPEMGL